jgi:hypothetical protein
MGANTLGGAELTESGFVGHGLVEEMFSVANSVELVLAESTGCGEDTTDCDKGPSGAPTNTWTRDGVVFTLDIYSVSAAINFWKQFESKTSRYVTRRGTRSMMRGGP